LILFSAQLIGCTNFELKNPSNGKEYQLAKKGDKCQKPKSFKNWTILYGTIPIKFLNKTPDKFLNSPRFRMKEKSGAIDIIASIILGFTTSISVRTIEIENCEAPIQPVILPESNPTSKENPQPKE
jgi:hypothetical protein